MNWKLTQPDGGTPQIDDWSTDDSEEDLSFGYSMIRMLAMAEHTLVEIAPGVWRHSADGVTYIPKD